MTRAGIAGCGVAVVLVLGAVAVGFWGFEKRGERRRGPSPTDGPAPEAATDAGPEASQGFLYGRITVDGGDTYEGRLRWGGGAEEAFWGDFWNGAKHENTWASKVPAERLPKERRATKIFGFEVGHRDDPIDLDRLFMARFGDIARVEERNNHVLVTLKSGTVFDLDRLEAGDFDDTVRVWDATRGVVDLPTGRIHVIEFLPTPILPSAQLGGVPSRLHGAVRTADGEFTGFVQWDRSSGVGSDELHGRTDDGYLRPRFDELRSIARRSSESSQVTFLDGREIVLGETRDVGYDNRGVYVDDPRYGKVLVSWEAFQRLDFTPAPAPSGGPAYGDFPPGAPLAGAVTTRSGRRLAGRLVYDLDESETTETLDAPSRGVDYTISFWRIASIVLPDRDVPGEASGSERARVILRSGEELPLERSGDLGEKNAGLLVFADGEERPEYVAWSEVARIDFAAVAARAAEN